MNSPDMNVLNQVVILFLILAVGYYSKKRGFIDSRVSQGLTDLLLNITVPCTILASFNMPFDTKMLYNASLIFVTSLFLHIGFFVISTVLYSKHPKHHSKVLRMISTFSNCAFMGYPVMQGIFGNIGVFYAAIYVIPFNIIIFSLGEIIFTGEKNIKGIIKSIMNPSIYAVIIGLIIFVNSMVLPVPVSKTISMIGSMTSPLSMIIIGSILADSQIKEVFKGITVYYGAFIRLIAAPVLTYFICKIFGISGIVMQTCVILQAMPAAALVSILAEKHGGDGAFASKCVFITTVFSIITIPLIVSIVK